MGLSKKPYRGCRDFFPTDMRIRDFLFSHMKEAAEQFAFEAYDGPLLEEVELYKAKSGEELINDQIYAFTDRGERHVAIRPEMTPTVARMAAQVHRETPKPIRWYAIPNLMRYEKPQRGRLREHWQFNADIFGAPELLGELEILSLAVHLMKSFGANNTMFSIQLNDRKVVDSIFNTLLDLGDQEAYKLYKVIDKSKKVSEEALQKMIGEIITNADKISIFNSYLKLTNFEELKSFLIEHKLIDECKNFNKITDIISTNHLAEYIQYDPTIVRGLDYYTGVVFEIFDKHPDNRRAIAGGGSYANLLQIFNEEPLSGIGFGLGDVTLRDFLETHNLLPDLSFAKNDLLIVYFDDDCEELALHLGHQLRLEKLKVETHLGPVKFKKAFKYAERKGHRHIAMIGSQEKEKGEIQLKNLDTKTSENIKISDIEAIKAFVK